MTQHCATVVDERVKQHLITSFSALCEKIPGLKPEVLVEKLLAEMSRPPEYSTLRINTMKYEKEALLGSVAADVKKTYGGRGADIRPELLLHDKIKDAVIVPNTSPSTSLTPCDKRIIVDHLCGSSVLRGANVFAPGVMAAPKGTRRGERVSVFADVSGKCRKGLATDYDGSVVFVGSGVLLQDRHDWFSDNPSSGIAVDMTNPLYVCPNLSCDQSCDMYYPQNFPSIVVSHVLDPQPHEVILDMCASPGGKTTHIASLMKNTGLVIAIDKNSPKVSKLMKTVETFKATSVTCHVYDSTRLTDTSAADSNTAAPMSSAVTSSPPYCPETFDRVLLDGPCSGLGQRPSLVYKLKLSEVLSYQKYQRKLIKQAVLLLKKGGTLVYSTCSVTPQENEEQVQWILDSYPSLALVDQDPFFVGYPGLPMCGLIDSQCSKVQRFGPKEFYSLIHKHCPDVYGSDNICFFIAKFIKRKN